MSAVCTKRGKQRVSQTQCSAGKCLTKDTIEGEKQGTFAAHRIHEVLVFSLYKEMLQIERKR